jgi:hypothetical protein
MSLARSLCPLTLAALLALGCDDEPTSPSARSAPPAGSGVTVPSAGPAVSAVASAPAVTNASAAPSAAATPLERVRSGELKSVSATSTGYRAELAAGGEVAVVFATKVAPLAPRAPSAHANLAALVAPTTVAPTAFRTLSLKHILAAADTKSRRKLGAELRVLADGNVEASLVLLPAKRMVTLEVGRILEGTRTHKWETELMSRTPPTEPTALLAAYQQVLAVDALCQNLLRTKVAVNDETKTVLALEGNDTFSAAAADGSVGDPLPRLSRHMVFSKALDERIRKLDRAQIDGALRTPGGGLLVTPMQVDEVVRRRDALQRLFERRIKRRGRDATLALP